MSSPITTHVLDTAKGRPAAGIHVVLERQKDSDFVRLGEGRTDADGRLRTLLPPGSLELGVYRLTFALDGYFGAAEHFFPEASLLFRVTDVAAHHHVPLLLSPFAYSTYRGS